MMINQLISQEKIQDIEPIVQKITSSITSAKDILTLLEKHLNTATAEKIVPLVNKLQSQAIIKVAIAELDKVLDTFLKILDFLREQSRQLIALLGVSSLLDPVVTGLDNLIQSGSADLTKLGVSFPQIIEGEGDQQSLLTDFIGTARDFLNSYKAFVLPEDQLWESMIESTTKIQGFSDTFKSQLD